MAARFKEVSTFGGWPEWLTRNLLKDRLPPIPNSGADTSEETPYQELSLGNLPYRPVVELPRAMPKKLAEFPDRKPFYPMTETSTKRRMPKAGMPSGSAVGSLPADRMVAERAGGLDPIVAATKEALEDMPVTQQAQAEVAASEEFDWEAEMRRREPWAGLQALGFGLMASKNPRFFGALGEAGLKAMSTVEGVADAARKEAATKLSKKALAEQERHAREVEARERQRIEVDERLRTEQLGLSRDTLEATVANQKAQRDLETTKMLYEMDPTNPRNKAALVAANAAAQNASTNAREALLKDPVFMSKQLMGIEDPTQAKIAGALISKERSSPSKQPATYDQVFDMFAKNDMNFLGLPPKEQDLRIRQYMSLRNNEQGGGTEIMYDEKGKRIK